MGWLGYATLISLPFAVAAAAVFFAGLRQYAVVNGHVIGLPDPRITFPILLLHSLLSIPFDIRRRRDRGRSGIDVVVARALIVASAAYFAFGHNSVVTNQAISPVFALTYLPQLYLLLVLLFLPGDKGSNRYGSRVRSRSAQPAENPMPARSVSKPAPTITELANAGRIGRARFIGNAIGTLLIMMVLAGLYMALGLAIGFNPPFYSTLMPRPGVAIILPGAGALLVLSLIYLVIYADLAVRRRHDRDRSGVDVIVWLEVTAALVIGEVFRPGATELLGFAAVSGLLGLYLFIVLVFLPGTRGPNRYGEDPRDTLRRAGH